MKKQLIIGMTSLVLGSSLFGFEVCGEKAFIGKNINVSKGWLKENRKSFGIEYDKYERQKGFQRCQVFTKKGSPVVEKIVKTVYTDTPLEQPAKLDNIPFSNASMTAYDINKRSKQVEVSSYGEFKTKFKLYEHGIRIINSTYKNKDSVLTTNTMCKNLSKTCSTTITLTNIDKKTGRESFANTKMKKIIEDQKLKLFKTEGWK